MEKATPNYEGIPAVKDRHLTVGKKVWQCPELNEVDYSNTKNMVGDGNDLFGRSDS